MTSRTKICGITCKEDALVAARAGADAIGLVFYAPSPRAVTVTQAAEIVSALPPFVTTVGLFVNPEPAFVHQVLAEVPLDLLQFHGDEPEAFCDQFDRRWIKAVRVRQSSDVIDAFKAYSRSSGLLVDAYDPKRYGGTGATFDWSMIPESRPLPLILAGGLNSANVSAAIEAVRPWAVDVSGGVEREKGIKDPTRIVEFLKEVNRVGKTD
ncbi:phosphoribosylanthranilate isomerase [Marinobacter sp. V034]|uniref:phosphoribosylanthranilate isomerase n=1 Tax=Marinobacter sp. V034 TaxID=3459610 RepID=UPI004044DC69